jgi:SAM-dependent methyltransferase
MVSAAEWERIQKIERSYHEQKDPAVIRNFSMQYWRRLLGVLPPELLSIEADTRVLDVGCGGAGILLAVEQGERTGVDPLMGYYLEKFPFLAEQPVRWLEGTAERLEAEESFEVVFSINALDHVYDPAVAASQMQALLAHGGRLVLVVNVHLTRWSRSYFSRFYRYVDPPHPHHFHVDRVPEFFPQLKLIMRRDVDDLWLDLEAGYKADVFGRKRRDPWKLLRNLTNPFQYPLALARILGKRPVHRRRPGDRPLMAGMLYVFRRDGRTGA